MATLVTKLRKSRNITFVPKVTPQSAKKIRISELLRGKTFYHSDQIFRIPFGNFMIIVFSYDLKMLEKYMIRLAILFKNVNNFLGII